MVIVIGLFLGLGFTITLPDVAGIGMVSSIVGTLIVLIWWLFFSRAPRLERLGAMAVMIAAWFAMRPLLDRSIIGGAMGALPVLGFTVFAVALVVWAGGTRNHSRGIRRASRAESCIR